MIKQRMTKFGTTAWLIAAAVCVALTGVLIAAAGPGMAAGRAPAAMPAAAAASTLPDCLRPPATCYRPRQFRVAYGVQPLLDRAIDGRGKTVVLPETAESGPPSPGVTDVRQDVARFDSLFGLPAARLQIVNNIARSAAPWLAGAEEVQDTEMVHAIAPGATIRELLVPPSALSVPASEAAALTAVIRRGTSLGDVISISASLGEHQITPAQATAVNSALQAAQQHHVTVVSSSGDFGAASDTDAGAAPVQEVSLAASDPLVLGVGGTSLTANPATGAYLGETAWNTLPQLPGGHSSASAGGLSHLFARPGYQDGVAGISASRGVPDVAGDAGFSTGMAIAINPGSQQTVLLTASGTSAATPFWAALITLADQTARRDLGFVNPAIYRIARSPLYRKAFHDITTGDNTVTVPPVTITGYPAAPGWDPVTGCGSPDAQVLVPLLARYAAQHHSSN